MIEVKKEQFLTTEERDLCGCNATPDKPGSTEDRDCIDQWKVDLEKVTNAYTTASANAIKAEGLFTNANTWKDKLKTWVNRAEDTDELAVKIASELEIFKTTVTNTVANTSKTVDAIKLLLCMVKDTFDDVFTLVRQSPPGDKGLIQELIFQIDCLTNVDERDKKIMLTCVAAYEEQMVAVYRLQKTILDLLLEVLNISYLLHQKIGSDDSGLATIIDNFINRLDGETNDDGYLVEWETLYEEDRPDDVNPPCDESILAPDPTGNQLFPIAESNYYSLLEKDTLKAERAASFFKGKMEEARKERDRFLSKRNSLLEAIKAAEAAEMA